VENRDVLFVGNVGHIENALHGIPLSFSYGPFFAQRPFEIGLGDDFSRFVEQRRGIVGVERASEGEGNGKEAGEGGFHAKR
jgi:hypothetical protein